MAKYHFHLPLTEELYQSLKSEAVRLKKPATKLAREAIEFWLKSKAKSKLHDEISAYAKSAACSPQDLDEDLEAASIEFLDEDEKGGK